MIDLEELQRLRALGYTGAADPLDPEASVGVVFHDAARASEGLNFFTNATTCSAQIIDMEGVLLHEWSYAPCFRWGNASLLPNGDIVVVGRMPYDRTDHEAAFRARYMLRMSFDGEVLWKKDIPVHHDVDFTPDQQLATLTYRHHVDSDVHPRIPVRDHQLVLTAQDGTPTNEISLLTALNADPRIHKIEPTHKRTFDGLEEIDLLHTNSLEFMRFPELEGLSPIYASSHVLLCMRHQDSIVILDVASEKVVYSWGRGILSGPHDATMLPNGHILVFDNGLGRKWSRVIELDPLEDKIVWEYRAANPKDFYTPTRGSNQRLSNGNTLIVESDSGRAFEVTSEGERVWEFINFNLTEKREPGIVVRMRRYEGLGYESLREQAAQGRLLLRD